MGFPNVYSMAEENRARFYCKITIYWAIKSNLSKIGGNGIDKKLSMLFGNFRTHL